MKSFSLPGIVFLVALAGATPSLADQNVLTDSVNAVPAVCVPVRNGLWTQPAYVTPDPANALASNENKNYIFVPGQGFMQVPWKRLVWNQFRDDNKDKYVALMDTGQYDHSYVVYEAYVDFYGEGQIRPVYSLVHMKSESLPEIFVQDDGSALSEGLKKLGASDLFEYGPRAYPIVRRPGHVSVYEIDTDLPGKQTFEQKKFIPTLICDFSLGGPAAPASAQASVPQGAAPAAALVQPPAATPVVPVAAPAAATRPFDACVAYQASNPAYYSACEDRLQKLQRLNGADGSN
jgi:hypothetical protein